MKRLRLRKVWVILAVILLVLPFIVREKIDLEATESSTEETTTVNTQFELGFEELSGAEERGEYLFWSFEPQQAEYGFGTINPATLTVFVKDGAGNRIMDTDIDSAKPIEWDISLKGADAAEVQKILTYDLKPATTSAQLFVTPKGAGVVQVELTGKVYIEGLTNPIPVSKNIIIRVPLQIKSSLKDGKDYIMLRSTDDLEAGGVHSALQTSGNIYTTQHEGSQIVWYYKNAVSANGRLPGTSSLENLELTDSPYIINPLSASGRVTTDGRGRYEEYDINSRFGGEVILVGRVYMNNDSSNKKEGFYVEDELRIFVASSVKANDKVSIGTDRDDTGFLTKSLTLDYGEQIKFQNISNTYEKYNTLDWSRQGDATLADFPVVNIDDEKGITGNSYGTDVLTIAPALNTDDLYDLVVRDNKLYDKLIVSTKFALLKGNVDTNRVEIDEIEVLNIGSSIRLSTNLSTKRFPNAQYEWYYQGRDGSWKAFPAVGSKDEMGFISVENVENASIGYSAIILKGEASGTLKIRCVVDRTGEVTPPSKEFTLKITDSLLVIPSSITMAVGQKQQLSAQSATLGEVTFTLEDGSTSNEYLSLTRTANDTKKQITITALKATPESVTLIATQEIQGQTIRATCKVYITDALVEGIIQPRAPYTSFTILKGGRLPLELIFPDGSNPNYTESQIEWVIKPKDSNVISYIEQDGFEATVRGENIGEAYVAVVLKDATQAEIAIATIRVVDQPTAITLSEHEVLGYIGGNNEITHQLEYTIEPEGYVDAEQVVVWQSLNPSVITVDENGLVTYVGVGQAQVKVSVSGEQELADYCMFTIEEPATSITLNPSTVQTLLVGETVLFNADVQPLTATTRTVTWSSSDPSIATVVNGLVTATAPGSTTITATTSNGLTASCVVNVRKPVEAIELNYTELTVKKNTVFYMAAKVLPEDAYDRTIIWTSSDENVVFIEADGTAQAVGTGEATITATTQGYSADGKQLTATCIVTVTESVTGITLNVNQKTIGVGEKFQLIATVHPSDAVDRSVTFTSSDPAIATVDSNGLVTGVTGGTVIIVVKTVDRGLIASCTVTVQEDITDIKLSATDITVAKGGDKKITYTLSPPTATMKNLKWTSSDERIAIVDNEGNVHGVNIGTATITAEARDGSGVKATCKVTVIDAVATITLSDKMIRLMAGETHQLSYTIEPSNATTQDVTWSSSDTSIARVDAFGLVTAVAEGQCTVTATATDGSGVTASCTVVVTPFIPITSIVINTRDTTMLVGETRTFTTRIYPENTTEAASWSSGDTSIVTVDQNGNVTAVGPGETTITYMGRTSGATATSTITVLGLNTGSITLEQYDDYDLYLDGLDTATVTWFSRNKRVATVDAAGNVVARRPGTTFIVARVNGKMVSCQVTVEKLNRSQN